MHAERAAPNGAKAFLSYFLCLTKSMGKDLILFVRSCCLGGLIRGLENLESPCEGVRVVTFCVVQKVTKKHARTCKKLPVASFCASETAETGRIANGREQGDHVSRRRLRPATSIQSSVGENLTEFSGGSSRTRFFAQNGGEKALNRCDVPVLQRKDLEQTAKEEPCSLRTVGYGWVEMGNGGWKRVALEGNQERLVQKKGFWFVKRRLSSAVRKVFYKKKCF